MYNYTKIGLILIISLLAPALMGQEAPKSGTGPSEKTSIQVSPSRLGGFFNIVRSGLALLGCEFGVSKKLIIKSGAKKYEAMNGKLTWSTKRTFYNLYIEHPKLVALLAKKISDAMHQDILESRKAND